MRKNKQHHKNRDLEALGDAIRDRRIDLELTQDELGNKALLHRTYVTDVEGGLRNISYITLLRIADGLKCSLSILISSAENEKKIARKSDTAIGINE
ncbi:MAG: helix-turn-helix transcriptional regulator [Candidatus Melainabacteria bacterium]|nr:helix-turn-helix transcriptional regulator [Candidatus Melainabacteria bacterium]